MKYEIIFILGCFLLKDASADFLNALVKITTGVEQLISTTIAKDCTFIKSIFGLTYNELVAAHKTPKLFRMDVELHTANESFQFNFTTAGDDILNCSRFDKSLPVVMYLHGFLTNPNSSNAVTMVNSLVKKGGANVLFLDASKLIYFFYLWASTVVEFIGDGLGLIIATLVKGGISANNIHLIGHSLGAHIAGFAGQSFYNSTGQKIGRISGMDPAGPCFYVNGANFTLSKDDATFVDVIHSDAGVFGIVKALGHVDFYPNSGAAQPNCLIPGQSHSRAWELYNETLYTSLEKGFIAVKCADWNTFKAGKCSSNERAYMGYAVAKNSTGLFFLKTAGSIPFGQGEAGVTIQKSAFQLFWEWLLGLFGIN